ncbi:hypothetical protein E9531_16760 [Lampropedia puyangensis]|uniref:Probable zinc-binding domain-containing protein n=1 Tax=Lampropedia puyangensis TaxID=1330072 RepID=A0A4S8EUG2_9BURK|nr:zinc-ribbon domain containing protein [Lampropedia puyangensis]THT96061.1 hypothetical protein E9531_16760 [Lampropedia puyangensis]
MAFDFSDYVEHPRFGRKPRYTGLSPKRYGDDAVLHWWSKDDTRIPNTAIAADCAKQEASLFPVTHYFDESCVCVDCKRPFLFFAAEQKYWYEGLQFNLSSACIRCPVCRKSQQKTARYKQRYETLLRIENPSTEQLIEKVACCLSLIEVGRFGVTKVANMRCTLKRIPMKPQVHSLWERIEKIESKAASRLAVMKPKPQGFNKLSQNGNGTC